MIDVIIPVYNNHDTIKKALLSIAMQTISDKIIVYIVDDASDVSYENEINNFKDVLNINLIKLEKNSGPGIARENGLENSSGKYILFLDSDDVFYDKYSIEKLFSSAKTTNSELVVGAIADERENNIYEYKNHNGCLHGKMYNREYIKKYNLHFNNTRNSEDNGFNKLYIMGNPLTSYVNDKVYLYRHNYDSLSSSINNFEMLKWFIYNISWAIDNALERKFDEYLINKYAFSTIVYVYSIYLINNKEKSIKKILKWVKPIVISCPNCKSILSKKDIQRILLEYNISFIENISFDEFMEIVKNV